MGMTDKNKIDFVSLIMPVLDIINKLTKPAAYNGKIQTQLVIAKTVAIKDKMAVAILSRGK